MHWMHNWLAQMAFHGPAFVLRAVNQMVARPMDVILFAAAEDDEPNGYSSRLR
jgi:hypothetical protein